jgi:integrase
MRTPEKPWYRKQNQTWYVKINGKQVRLSKDRAEAKRLFHKLLSDGKSPSDPKLSACIALYLENLKGTDNTRRNREQLLGRFLAHVGDRRVSALTEDHLQSFLQPGWSSSSTRTAIVAINACLNHCVKRGKIDRNPLKSVEKPTWERRERELTAGELGQLLDAAEGPFRSILTALVESGCRPSEVCGLTVEDSVLDQGVWLVSNKTRGKTGVRKRPVYLSLALRELTREAIGDRTEGFVFRNAYGDPWTPDTIRLRFRRLRKKLGLSNGAIPYNCRSRFVTTALENGIDPLTVSELVGHTGIDMVKKHYARLGKEHMRKAIEQATKREK